MLRLMEKATPSSTVILLLLFALMPFLAPILGEAFYIDVFVPNPLFLYKLEDYKWNS